MQLNNAVSSSSKQGGMEVATQPCHRRVSNREKHEWACMTFGVLWSPGRVIFASYCKTPITISSCLGYTTLSNTPQEDVSTYKMY